MRLEITLAEIESALRKAARASGLPWGLAEEAGKAARWLAAFDLNGPELMLEHLENLRGPDYRLFIPDCDADPWKAPGGILCPIVTGAALADRAAQLLGGKQIELAGTAFPLLLVATLGQAARFYDTGFCVEWSDLRVECTAWALGFEGRRLSMFAQAAPSVLCRHQPAAKPGLRASARSYGIDGAVWQRIEALAFETYAPATEASRAGAGAGLVDND